MMGQYPVIFLTLKSAKQPSFESSLKSNSALERAVITGCLRISKESIFTGLNHLVINSMLGKGFSEGFGFTQQETEDMLEHYGLGEKKD